MSEAALALSALPAAAVEESPGVWRARPGVHAVGDDVLDELERVAAARGRSRVLLHGGRDDVVQQMVIALSGTTYIRPHLNDRGYTGWHVLRGRLLFALFDDDGGLREAVELDGGNRMVRLLGREFHTILPLSPGAVYVETCQGPFHGTTYADWAPAEDDAAAPAWVAALLEEVERRG